MTYEICEDALIDGGARTRLRGDSIPAKRFSELRGAKYKGKVQIPKIGNKGAVRCERENH